MASISDCQKNWISDQVGLRRYRPAFASQKTVELVLPSATSFPAL
jgi:hypothetical protein